MGEKHDHVLVLSTLSALSEIGSVESEGCCQQLMETPTERCHCHCRCGNISLRSALTNVRVEAPESVDDNGPDDDDDVGDLARLRVLPAPRHQDTKTAQRTRA